MPAYLGTLDAFGPVACPSSESRQIGRESTEVLVPAGSRVVFEAQRSFRSWSVSAGAMTPGEVATWELFAHRVGMAPPFYWISAWAASHNLLPPRDSLVAPDTLAGPGVFSTAPITLDTGETVRQSVAVSSDDATIGLGYDQRRFRYRQIPVVEGTPITASVWVASNGAARIVVYWRDIAGGEVEGRPYAQVSPGLGRVSRVSVTATPPVGAVSCELRVSNARVITRPAVTYTAEARPWTIGDGCYSAYVTDTTLSPLYITRGASYASSGFVVTELEV